MRRLHERLRSVGLGPTLRKAMRDHVFRREEHVFLVAELDARRPHTSPPGVEIRSLHGGDEADIAAACDAFPNYRSAIRDALGQDCLVFVAFRHGRPGGLGLFALEDVRDHAYLRRTLRVPPGCAYAYALYACPHERTSGLAPALIEHALAAVAAASRRRLWAIAPKRAEGLIRLYQGFGGQLTGETITHWRLGPLKASLVARRPWRPVVPRRLRVEAVRPC